MEFDISLTAGGKPRDSQVAVKLHTSNLCLGPSIGQQGVGIAQTQLQEEASRLGPANDFDQKPWPILTISLQDCSSIVILAGPNSPVPKKTKHGYPHEKQTKKNYLTRVRTLRIALAEPAIEAWHPHLSLSRSRSRSRSAPYQVESLSSLSSRVGETKPKSLVSAEFEKRGALRLIRDQRNVDSPSAAVSRAARGLL